MPVPTSGIVTVRLAPRDVDDIDEWVGKGRFTSRSDFLRYAVRVTAEALRAQEREESLDVGTLLHGPGSLPAAQEDASAKRGRPHQKKVTRQ